MAAIAGGRRRAGRARGGADPARGEEVAGADGFEAARGLDGKTAGASADDVPISSLRGCMARGADIGRGLRPRGRGNPRPLPGGPPGPAESPDSSVAAGDSGFGGAAMGVGGGTDEGGGVAGTVLAGDSDLGGAVMGVGGGTEEGGGVAGTVLAGGGVTVAGAGGSATGGADEGGVGRGPRKEAPPRPGGTGRPIVAGLGASATGSGSGSGTGAGVGVGAGAGSVFSEESDRLGLMRLGLLGGSDEGVAGAGAAAAGAGAGTGAAAAGGGPEGGGLRAGLASSGAGAGAGAGAGVEVARGEGAGSATGSGSEPAGAVGGGRREGGRDKGGLRRGMALEGSGASLEGEEGSSYSPESTFLSLSTDPGTPLGTLEGGSELPGLTASKAPGTELGLCAIEGL